MKDTPSQLDWISQNDISTESTTIGRMLWDYCLVLRRNGIS